MTPCDRLTRQEHVLQIESPTQENHAFRRKLSKQIASTEDFRLKVHAFQKGDARQSVFTKACASHIVSEKSAQKENAAEVLVIFMELCIKEANRERQDVAFGWWKDEASRILVLDNHTEMSLALQAKHGGARRTLKDIREEEDEKRLTHTMKTWKEIVGIARRLREKPFSLQNPEDNLATEHFMTSVGKVIKASMKAEPLELYDAILSLALDVTDAEEALLFVSPACDIVCAPN